MRLSVLAGGTLITLALALTGCSTPNQPTPEFGPRPTGETANRLPFLRDGITTRAEITARLGEPDGTLPDDRTLFYKFAQAVDGGLRPMGVHYVTVVGLPEADLDWHHRFQLVLTFDDNGRLVRHTLIEKPGMQWL